MASIAVVQMCSGREVADNLGVAAGLIEQAAIDGAELVVLPENFAQMDSDARRREIAEAPGDGPIQSFMSSMAKENKLWLVGGTMPIQRDPEQAPAATTLVYDERGHVVADYDKIHLFDVGIPGSEEAYVESRHTSPGRRLICLDSPVGKLGIAVCYDVRFPEQMRALADQGMEVLAVPAAFTVRTGEAHWEVLLRARAVENLCYVAAAAQAGSHQNGRQTWGHSMLVNPWGKIMNELAAGAGVVSGTVDRKLLKTTRDRFPVLAHRQQSFE